VGARDITIREVCGVVSPEALDTVARALRARFSFGASCPAAAIAERNRKSMAGKISLLKTMIKGIPTFTPIASLEAKAV